MDTSSHAQSSVVTLADDYNATAHILPSWHAVCYSNSRAKFKLACRLLKANPVPIECQLRGGVIIVQIVWYLHSEIHVQPSWRLSGKLLLGLALSWWGVQGYLSI